MAAGLDRVSQDYFASLAWQWLGRELDRWVGTGVRARFWWRDDDATTANDRLDRLLSMSHGNQLPLSLAVIPAAMRPGLALRLNDQALVSVLQHGYAHENHAAPGQRKLEIGGTRSRAAVAADLGRGFDTLGREFGDRFKAVLVPPWNRIDESVLPRLSGIGFIGISAMKARRRAHPAAGLLQVNAHLDPVNWRHDGSFIGAQLAIAVLVQHLVAKRSGYRDAQEPTGILTHHLVQNEAVWQFVGELLRFLRRHPGAAFVGADEIWQ